MQKKDHCRLQTRGVRNISSLFLCGNIFILCNCVGLQNDKFDQFWAINRRFMEPGGGEDFFKHIPLRFHMVNSHTVLQKLVKPVRYQKLDIILPLPTSVADP
jgi:hypothetical protein